MARPYTVPQLLNKIPASYELRSLTSCSPEPASVPILSEMDPVHIIPIYVLGSQVSHSFRLSDKIVIYISVHSFTAQSAVGDIQLVSVHLFTQISATGSTNRTWRNYRHYRSLKRQNGKCLCFLLFTEIRIISIACVYFIFRHITVMSQCYALHE